MDPQAPDNVLEVTARAMTYYLDISVDCSRRISSIKGALSAIILRLNTVDLSLRVSKDLAEQCVKVCFSYGARVLIELQNCFRHRNKFIHATCIYKYFISEIALDLSFLPENIMFLQLLVMCVYVTS